MDLKLNKMYSNTIKYWLCGLCFLCGYVQLIQAQNIGINNTGATPDPTAMLDISSSDKGLLIPRMNTSQRLVIPQPAIGLMVFDSTINSFMVFDTTMSWQAIAISKDTLGNHLATQNIHMNNQWISNDGDSEGIYLDSLGRVGIGTIPEALFHVAMGAGEPGFRVDTNSITFNRYTFPSDVGAGGQILVTDGNGQLNWSWSADTDHQDLSFSNDTLFLTNDLSPVGLRDFLDNTDQQDLTLSNDTLRISNGTTPINMNGGNTDQQDLSMNSNILSLTNDATTVDLNNIPFPDQQDLSLSGNTLSLVNDATTVDLSSLIDADQMGNSYATQNLQLNGQWLSNDGNNEGIRIDANGQVGIGVMPSALFHVPTSMGQPGFRVTANNFLLDGLTFPSTDGNANQVLVSDGNGILSWADQFNTDSQDLSLATNLLSITNDATPVDLSNYLDNTDSQDLSLLGNVLSLSNDASSVDLSIYTNTDHQGLSFSNDSLFLTNDMTAIGLDVFRQGLSKSANTLSLSGDATTVDLGVFQQDLSLSGNTLSLSGDVTTVDLSGLQQDLSLSGNSLSLSGDVSPVDMSTYVNIDQQDLSLSSSILSLSNDASTVDLLTMDKVDAQDLSLNANSLSVTNDASPVDLTPYYDTDNMGNHIAQQNLQLNNHWLSGDGHSEGINIDPAGQVGIGKIPEGSFNVNTTPHAETIFDINTNSTTIYTTDIWQSFTPTKTGTLGALVVHYWFPFGTSTNCSLYLGEGTGGTLLLSSVITNQVWLPAVDVLLTEGQVYTISLHNPDPAAHTILSTSNPYSGGRCSTAPNDDMGIQLDLYVQYEGLIVNPTGVGIDIIPTTNALEIQSDLAYKITAGSWLANSDARLKKNIQALSPELTLQRLLKLQGVNYEWDDQQTGKYRPLGIQYGFIAQNIQKPFPTLVLEDSQGFLQTAYGTFDAMMVESLRALYQNLQHTKRKSDALEQEFEGQKSSTAELGKSIEQQDRIRAAKARLEQLKSQAQEDQGE